VAHAVLDRLAAWRQVQARDGFAPVRTAWLSRGPALGESITFRVGGRRVQGAFAGLDDDGGLLLDREGRLEKFSAGEVLQGD
jgi:BirA family biotin operon repressor/biotin-[acetyl-CoA-carboxylase] ligase